MSLKQTKVNAGDGLDGVLQSVALLLIIIQDVALALSCFQRSVNKPSHIHCIQGLEPIGEHYLHAGALRRSLSEVWLAEGL
jgi:hypothetical protein